MTEHDAVTCADCGAVLTTWYAQVYHHCPQGDTRRPHKETIDAVADELARDKWPR